MARDDHADRVRRVRGPDRAATRRVRRSRGRCRRTRRSRRPGSGAAPTTPLCWNDVPGASTRNRVDRVDVAAEVRARRAGQVLVVAARARCVDEAGFAHDAGLGDGSGTNRSESRSARHPSAHRPFYATATRRIRTDLYPVRIRPVGVRRTRYIMTGIAVAIATRSSPPSSPPGSTAGEGAAAGRCAATRVRTRTRPRPRPTGSGRACGAGPTASPSPAGSTRPSSCAARCVSSPTARSTTPPRTTLATRLGVSARHLRRLFARARRRDAERGRPFAASALRPATARRHRPADGAASRAAAGFQSVRHMNRVVKQVFRFTPAGAAGPAARPATPRRRRRARAPAAVPRRRSRGTRCCAFLAPRAIPGVEHVDLDARRVPPHDRARRRAGGDRGRRTTSDRAALLLRAHLSRLRRPRPPRRAGSPAVRPRRRPRRRSTRTSRATRGCDRSCARTAGCGSRAPIDPRRDRRPRDPRPAGVGRARDRARGHARRPLRHAASPGSTRSASPHLFPEPRPSPTRRSTTSGSPATPGRRDPGVRRARDGAARRLASASTTSSGSCGGSRASASGPRSTSRCGPPASGTRSRPAISASATRSAGPRADVARRGRRLPALAGLCGDAPLVRPRRRARPAHSRQPA